MNSTGKEMITIARVDIRTIRKLIDKGMSIADIAKQYGVSKQAIYQRIKADDEKKAMLQISTPTAHAAADYHTRIDPETGLAVENRGQIAKIVGKMGDEKVTAFVNYHMDMMAMRQGCNKKDVQDLYNRFYNYLRYCSEHGIIPNNMNAYYAIGILKEDVYKWRHGIQGTPDHRQFAEDVASFFASIHEQGAIDGMFNPISSIFWQKAYDGLSDQPKIEVSLNNPLGETRSSEEIAKAYDDLPD